MDALKNEVRTGKSTGGRWHDQKLIDQKNALEKLINGEKVVKIDPITKKKLKKNEWYNLKLSSNDKKIAQSTLKEVKAALSLIPSGGLVK